MYTNGRPGALFSHSCFRAFEDSMLSSGSRYG